MWRDRLIWADESNILRKKASFRGAYFFVRDSEVGIGRRNIVHQYPFKDDPYIEDLGKDTDEFTINGYVIQNSDNDQDYIGERDALIEALRESGPGTLIHPYYGEITVNLLGKARVAESFTEGGIARFTMTFVKASGQVALSRDVVKKVGYPKTSVDYQQAVDEVADISINYIQDGFGEIYDPDNMPGFSSDAIVEAVDSLNLMLRSVTRSIQGAFPSQVSTALEYLADAYSEIDLTTIIDSCSFASSIIEMFNGLKSISGMYGDILSDELLGACSGAVYGFYSGPMSIVKASTLKGRVSTTGFSDSTMEKSSYLDEKLGKTSVRALLEINLFGEETGSSDISSYGGTITSVAITSQQKAKLSANLICLINLARAFALITAARAALRIKYTSYNSVMEIMQEVIDAFNNFLLKLGNDSSDTDYDEYNITVSDPKTYNAIDSLRPVFVESMIGLAGPLAKVINYQAPPTTISTLQIAYDKYLDLDRESEIIERNTPLIKNPGFVDGLTLEVLSS